MKDDEGIAKTFINYFSETESKLVERVPTNGGSSAEYLHSIIRITLVDDTIIFQP